MKPIARSLLCYGCLLGRGRWRFQPCVFCHHTIESDSDTFNDGEEHSATDSIVSHCFGTAADRKGAACTEASEDGIPWILFLPEPAVSLPTAGLPKFCRVVCAPDSLHSTIERREESAPNTKIAAQDWSSCLYGCNCADASFAIGRVPAMYLSSYTLDLGEAYIPKAFNPVPYCSSDGLKAVRNQE